jgi:hypothetical protein
MSIFDIFKKKAENKPQPVSCDGFPMPVPGQPNPYLQGTKLPDGTTTVAPDLPKKTMKELFEEWYNKLSPEQKKRVDKKIEKMALKAGTSVCCTICKNPGSNKALGPFRKVNDGKGTKALYAHENCLKEVANATDQK